MHLPLETLLQLKNSELPRLLYERTHSAALTLPTTTAELWLLGLLVLYAAIALPVGFRQRLFRFEMVQQWSIVIPTLLIALIFPALLEEWVFRVLLLPMQTDATLTSVLGWSSLSLGIFVAAHPLNALIFFPSRRATFTSPTFLVLASLLGVVCTIAYLQSHSLWPPVAIHWFLVVVWLLWLGGYQRMTPLGQ
ncbi:MAG: CPBP family glutamic-type intramembrane protease [Cyanobacteria bacterium P01_H01_bin.121]